MNSESPAVNTNDILPPVSTPNSTPQSFTSTWITSLICLACVGIWIGITTSEDVDILATLAKFGYLPAKSIWEGHYWALITSNFVHVEVWHLALNVYWLWTLGSRIERSIGSFRYLAFLLTAAFVNTAYQLMFSDSTGIGASASAMQSSDSCGWR